MRKIVVTILVLASLALILLTAVRRYPQILPAQLGPGDSLAAFSSGNSDLGTVDPSAPRRHVREVRAPSLRANPADRIFLDSIRLADNFDALIARARKEPAFAFALAFALHQCASADESYRRLRDTLNDRVVTKSPEERLKAADRAYAKCAGIQGKQMDNRYDLVTAAARSGVLEAQNQYTQIISKGFQDGTLLRKPNAVDEFRSNAESFIVAAARTGDAAALNNAYNWYSSGRFVPRDPVLAYQYLERLVRLQPALAPLLSQTEAQLTPEQRARARMDP